MADDMNGGPDSSSDEERAEKERRAKQDAELAALKDRIDAELRMRRPDRYQPGDDWLDDVVTAISDQVPMLSARQMAARTLVGQREGQATKKVNKFLKGLAGADGQYALPVDWHFYADEPVAFEQHIYDEDGQLQERRRERVALRAMLAADWAVFSESGRIEAQRRKEAEDAMYDAADWVAKEQGVNTFARWADIVAPRGDEAGGHDGPPSQSSVGGTSEGTPRAGRVGPFRPGSVQGGESR